MLRVIIEKELRDMLGSTRFVVTFGICTVLILLSFFLGIRSYHADVSRLEAAKRENIRKMEGLNEWLSLRETRIFLPVEPLACLVTGVSHDIGRTVVVHGRGELGAEDSRFGDDPLFAVFRFLDLDFVFTVILSLFAILFAYDSVNGEKERGTLRLTFANPLPRTTFIVGKMIGACLALAVPLLIPLLLGCLLLVLLGMPMSPGEWLRLWLILAAGLLFLAVIVTTSVAVSALTKRSSTSFLILLVIWIAGVLILPRTAVMIAGRAVSVPSVDELSSQKMRLSSQLWSEQREKMNRFKPTPGLPPDQMMKEFQKYMDGLNDARDKKMAEFGGRLNEERRNKQDVQEGLAFMLARISPAAAFSLAATRLAGTSIELKQHFLDEASTYQKAYGAFMTSKTGINPGGGMMIMRIDNGAPKTPINPNELPLFGYAPLLPTDLAGALLIDILVLCLFLAAGVTTAFIGFSRYDLR